MITKRTSKYVPAIVVVHGEGINREGCKISGEAAKFLHAVQTLEGQAEGSNGERGGQERGQEGDKGHHLPWL